MYYRTLRNPILGAALTLWLVFGCGNKSQSDNRAGNNQRQQQAYERVLAIHDEVMPRLAGISRLRKELKNRLADSTDSLAIAHWLALDQRLQAADEAMWVWMRQFRSDLSGLPPAEALAYLQQQQQQIEAVAAEINTAIADAEEQLAGGRYVPE